MVQEKFVLITGGTQGIGRELASLFAADGHNLILVARDQGQLDATASELHSSGVQIVTISKDLFEPEAAFELYDEIRGMDLDVQILVNDAGQGLYGEFKDTDLRRELKIIQLNISSVVVLTKLFLRDMIAKGGGRILNLSSIASKTPGPWQSVYHGTKAFIQSFTEALRSEIKDHDIVVTALLPGATDTEFFNKAGMNESKMVQENSLADPAKVAEDGYKALMNDESMVVSGLKNKLTVAMAAVTPDAKLADKMNKQQEPVNKK